MALCKESLACIVWFHMERTKSDGSVKLHSRNFVEAMGKYNHDDGL